MMKQGRLFRLVLALVMAATTIFSTAAPIRSYAADEEQQAPINYVANPGFETGDLTDWNFESNIDLDNGEKRYGVFTEAGGYLSSYRLSLWAGVDYKATASQVVLVPNGTYSLTAKVKNSGGQNSVFLYAKDYGGAELKADIIELQGWTTIVIQGIKVTNGQCEIGLYSDSPAGKWTNLDDVTFGIGDDIEPIDIDESPIPQLDLGAYYEIVSRDSEKALNYNTETSELSQGAFAHGDTIGQKWQMIYAGYGYVKIINKANDHLLTSALGNLVGTVEASADDGQLWQLNGKEGGYYEIRNKASGKVLDLSGDQIIESTSNNDDSQQWNFVKVGNAPFIIGADPSYLQEYEPIGTKYYEDGIEKDALEIYHNNGFTYARLRVWNNPEDGYYNKENTLALAKRCYDRGFKLMIDFHYSDTWGDAKHQNAPAEWADMTFEEAEEAMIAYTKDILSSLKKAGIDVDMVQIGNEINTGMMWPFGEVDHGDNPNNWDNFASLLKSGIQAAKDVFPKIKTIVHSDTGTDNAANRYFFDKLISRGVEPDILGFSYYTSWHGKMQDLYNNLNDMVSRYGLPVMIVENSQPWKEAGFYKGSEDYPLTVEGQTQFYKDLLKTARSVKDGMCLGVIQWGTDGIRPPGYSQWHAGTLFDYDGNKLSSMDVFKNNADEQSIKVTGVKLNKNSLDLAIGLTASVVADVAPSNVGNPAVLWSSDNKNVATVDARGQIIAISKGVATITATTADGSFTDVLTVTVPDPGATLSDIKVDGQSITNFDPAVKSYNVFLAAESGSLHSVSATPTNASAIIEITQATDFPGQAILTVTSPNQATTYTYTVNLDLLAIVSIQNPSEVVTESGQAPDLPDTVLATYNDGTVKLVNVLWDTVDAQKYASTGEFSVRGTAEGTDIAPLVKVIVVQRQPVQNPGFESKMNNWTVTSNSNTQAAAYLGKASDSHSGIGVLNYWSGSKYDFIISQRITGLENGKYKLSAWTRGSGGEEISRLYAIPGGGKKSTIDFSNKDEWAERTLSDIIVTDGTITIGAEIDANAGNWGFFDDFGLFKVGELTPTPAPMPIPILVLPPVPEIILSNDGNTTVISVVASAMKDMVTGTVAVKIMPDTVKGLIEKLCEVEESGQKAIVAFKVKLADDAKSVELEIPSNSLKQILDNSKAAIKMDMGIGTVTFNTKAIKTINQSASAESIKTGIKKVESTALPEQVHNKIGDRPVYDFFIKSGDSKNLIFDGGNVEIEIPYTLHAGEKEEAIVIYDIDDTGQLQMIRGKYESASGQVKFTVKNFSKYAIGYNEVNFSDVATNAWYAKAVAFMSARKIVKGVGNGLFEPEKSVTRADFLIMVMNSFGIELDSSVSGDFMDAGNKYYTNYLATAKRLGLANGVDDNKFAPETTISRQDMFTLLYRVLEILDELPARANGKSLDNYKDANHIASYATEALKFFSETGMIVGDGNNLFPKSVSTRAQAAQVLYNLHSR